MQAPDLVINSPYEARHSLSREESNQGFKDMSSQVRLADEREGLRVFQEKIQSFQKLFPGDFKAKKNWQVFFKGCISGYERGVVARA